MRYLSNAKITQSLGARNQASLARMGINRNVLPEAQESVSKLVAGTRDTVR
jgi:hypothetical protein